VINGKKIVPVKQLLRELNEWEVNEHCIRSLFSGDTTMKEPTSLNSKGGKF
jgi:hypothetical protein